MKKNLSTSLFFLALLTSINTIAQEFSVSAGYQYIYSSEWDNAIQRYNFSKPSSDQNHPLLVHGTYLGGSYFFATDKRFQSGIKLAHSFSKSTVTNEEKISFNLHQLELAYSLRHSFKGKLSPLMLEADLAALSTLLSKNIDNQVELIDDEANRAFGVGIKTGVNLFYNIEMKQGRSLIPFIGLAYSPYIGSPESESVLDPSISLNGTKDVQLYSWKVGLRYSFNKEN